MLVAFSRFVEAAGRGDGMRGGAVLDLPLF